MVIHGFLRDAGDFSDPVDAGAVKPVLAEQLDSCIYQYLPFRSHGYHSVYLYIRHISQYLNRYLHIHRIIS